MQRVDLAVVQRSVRQLAIVESKSDLAWFREPPCVAQLVQLLRDRAST